MDGCDHSIVFSVCCVVSDIDECASEPCQHKGTCTDHVDRYTCTCASGYRGASCQTGRSLLCLEDIKETYSEFMNTFAELRNTHFPMTKMLNKIRNR